MRTPVGFESIAATITDATGEVCDVCFWLADDADLRARGLMRIDELGVADGMVFVYESDVSTRFWMKNTEIALSIAYFDAVGHYVGQLDMEPCVTSDCETYEPPGKFRMALEMPVGDLESFGVGPGSVLRYTPMPCSGV